MKKEKEKPIYELFVEKGKLYGRNLSKIDKPVYYWNRENKKWIKMLKKKETA